MVNMGGGGVTSSLPNFIFETINNKNIKNVGTYTRYKK